eukprot:13687525-Alexandrium_andersonii.AAC.1
MCIRDRGEAASKRPGLQDLEAQHRRPAKRRIPRHGSAPQALRESVEPRHMGRGRGQRGPYPPPGSSRHRACGRAGSGPRLAPWIERLGTR